VAANRPSPDLLHGPIIPTLLRLASPNVAGLFAQTLTIAYDGYIVARLGTDALAAVALVFPLSMLMVQLSRAAIGGGVAAAVARALGSGSEADAATLAWHGVVIEVTLGVALGLALLFGGPALYGAMGGRGAIAGLAQAYALPLFAGAFATWLHNGLASVHSGSGNMRLPAACLVGNALAHLALCPLLVFGWGPVPAVGIGGASLSFVALNGIFACVLLRPLAAGRAAVRLRPLALDRRAAFEVLRVGVPASVSPFISNGNVIVLTGYAGAFGTATLAGYGVGARLEYLLIPLVFGFGAALLAMVGRNIGAGNAERAARIAWNGSLLVAAIAGGIGIVLALAPSLWTRWFIPDAASPARAAADLYLHIAGAFYGPFGFGLAFFFASQGAGRLTWPLAGSVARIVVAVAGGAVAVAVRSLPLLYVVIGCSFLAYAAVPAIAFKRGAWDREQRSPKR
jgi:putative MATE family efflux protein